MLDADTVTDGQIRDERRRNPALLDTLMIAIHGTNLKLRATARSHFATIINTRTGA